MEPDGDSSHSASVQSCSELFPGNCLDRARVELRHPAFDLDPPRVLDAFLGFGVYALDQKPHEGGAFFRIELHRLFEQLSRRLCHAPILSLGLSDCCPSNAPASRLCITRAAIRPCLELDTVNVPAIEPTSPH